MHADIHIYTYKTGLLARVAHDLQLSATQHELTLQGRHVRGSCAVDGIRVDGALSAKGLEPNTLSDKDKNQIVETIRTDIFAAAQHPKIDLDGEVSGPVTFGTWRVTGTLRIRGRSRPLSVELKQTGEQLQAAFELTPSEFGIAPYKALAGAIKLQDRVRVTIDIALDGQKPDELLTRVEPVKFVAASSG